ncbi:MAG: hypothetical protein QXS20_05155 [Candidatus Thorarchaeota archaeon]
MISAVVLLGASLPASAASMDGVSDIKVTVVSACYGDFDLDSYTDDAYVLVRFNINNPMIVAYNTFYYWITFMLPSGTTYVYLIYVRAWANTVEINHVFYNHVTEPGYYTVNVIAYLTWPGIAYNTATYMFDPPGGSDGGEPTFGVF